MIAKSRAIALQREHQPPEERQQSSCPLPLPTLSPPPSASVCVRRTLATAVASGVDSERTDGPGLELLQRQCQYQNQYEPEYRDRCLGVASGGKLRARAVRAAAGADLCVDPEVDAGASASNDLVDDDDDERHAACAAGCSRVCTAQNHTRPEARDVSAEAQEAGGTETVTGAQEHRDGPDLLVATRGIRSHGKAKPSKAAEQQPTTFSDVQCKEANIAEGGLQTDIREGVGKRMLLILVRVQEVSEPSTIARTFGASGSSQSAERTSSFGDVRLMRVQTPVHTEDDYGDGRGEVEGGVRERRGLNAASAPSRSRQGSIIGDYLPRFEYDPLPA